LNASPLIARCSWIWGRLGGAVGAGVDVGAGVGLDDGEADGEGEGVGDDVGDGVGRADAVTDGTALGAIAVGELQAPTTKSAAASAIPRDLIRSPYPTQTAKRRYASLAPIETR
jgi:hypothetical protein